jgi:hypothetical protein
MLTAPRDTSSGEAIMIQKWGTSEHILSEAGPECVTSRRGS